MNRIPIQPIFLVVFVLISITMVSCTMDSEEALTPTQETLATIWSGPRTTFSMRSGADPTLAENQDRITDKVWLTRGSNGGQLYNAVSESVADKATSPAGTQWAVGTTAELDSLRFSNFRTAIGKPREAVGQDLVLLLVEDSIAIDIRITSWTPNQLGGFSYERSTN